MSENKIQLLKKLVDEHFNNIEYLTLQINESQIAIVCHCSKKYQTGSDNPFILHQTLYYINIKNKYIIKEIGKNIKYVDVDPSCPDDIWDNITNESLMYIWGINCDIYRSFNNGDRSKIINDILQNSFNKLKLNGKVYFPVMKNMSLPNLPDSKKKLIEFFTEECNNKSNGFNGFNFKIESIDDFPYIIGLKSDLDFAKDEKIKEYYVFTKNTNKKN